MKQKLLAYFFILILISTLLPACKVPGNPDDEPPAENEHIPEFDEVEEDPVTLTMNISSAQPIQGLEAVIKAAEEKLNITVQVNVTDAGASQEDWITTHLAEREKADFYVTQSGASLVSLDPELHFEDLSDYEFISTLGSDYLASVTAGDKIYGIPFSSSRAGVWLYNRKIYRDLELEVPETWEQLLNNCEIIKNAGKPAVIGSSQDNPNLQYVLLMDYYNTLQAEPDFTYNFIHNAAKFSNTPAALRSFEKLSELSPYLNEGYLDTGYAQALELLISGDGAHYPMLTSALTDLSLTYPSKLSHIGAFPQPGDSSDSRGLTIFMPDSIYLSNHCSNKKAALKWMKFYISEEGLAAYQQALKPEGPYLVEDISMPENISRPLAEIQAFLSPKHSQPALEFVAPLKSTQVEQITLECISGSLSAEDAAAAYDENYHVKALDIGLEGW